MQLPHGYTNETELTAAGTVRKRYVGTDARERQRREVACLSALAPVLPVPAVVATHDGVTVMEHLRGRHGQELIEEGHADHVLRLAGRLLRRLGTVAVTVVPDLGGSGRQIVHGDFGPQNMLLDLGRSRVTALLDWEFAHRGDPTEDLAWCEWIVRMHHPASVGALPALFTAYGERPPWAARQRSMIAKCQQLEERCRAEGLDEVMTLWAERRRQVAGWQE